MDICSAFKNPRWFYILICLINVILLINALMVNSSVFSSVNYISCVPLLIFILISKPKTWKLCKKKAIYSFFLMLIFLLMLSLEELVKSFYFSSCSNVHKVFLLINIFISVYYCMYSFIDYLSSDGVSGSSNKEIVQVNSNSIYRNRSFLFSIGIISFFALLCLYSTDRGVWIEGDVKGMMDCVTFGVWNDWHPIAYMFLVKACLNFGNEGSVLFFDTILWIIINVYVLCVIRRVTNRDVCMVIYAIVNMVVFSTTYYLEVMYKDIPSSMCMLATTAFIIDILISERVKKTSIVFGLVGFCGVAVFRHAGEIPIYIVCICLLVYFCIKKCTKKIVIMIGLFVIVVLTRATIHYVAFNIMDAEPNPSYVTYGSPIYMISAALSNDLHFDEHDTAIIEKWVDLETLEGCYNKYWVDDCSRTWGIIGEDNINELWCLIDNEQYGIELLKINAKLFLNHPLFYVQHLLDPSSILWEIAQTNDGYNMALVNSSINEEITYYSSYEITQSIGKFTFNNPIYNVISWRGGLSLFIIIFYSAICIYRKQTFIILALVPVMVVSALLIITTPSQDPRYCLPLIEVAVLLISIMKFELLENKKDKREMYE